MKYGSVSATHIYIINAFSVTQELFLCISNRTHNLGIFVAAMAGVWIGQCAPDLVLHVIL